jgi:glycosyltransferase involved in cell wall biosynthesis
VRASGLADVVCCHGFLAHEQLRPLVEAADLLLVSSRHEGDPIALLEAAVAGVPAVGTSVGHLAEWAPDACLAVPVGDHVALAAAAAALLSDDERRLRLAHRAQSLALALDADRTAASVLRHYVALTRRMTVLSAREPSVTPARLV